MTIALTEPQIRAAISPKTDALELKNDRAVTNGPAEFGQVMSDVMNLPTELAQSLTRQVVADTAPPLPVTLGSDSSLGGDFLKAIHLGPHLNVITSETTLPDDQSLEAFARSQGLDETAVQWLMGNPASLTTQPIPVSNAETPPQEVAILPILDSTLHRGLKLNTLEVSSSMTTATPVAQAADENVNLAGIPMKTGAQTKSDTQPLNNAFAAAALWAMAQPTESARVSAPEQKDLSDVAKVQINLMAPAAPTALWMLRNTQTVTAQKETLPNHSGLAESELDLSEIASSELLESLAETLSETEIPGSSEAPPALAGQPSSAQTGHPGQQHGQRQDSPMPTQPDTLNTDASSPSSGPGQRSEDVQKLAEKMGQAVGQRILSEIEKGQWHLKLSLRPATLGHIEVEMRMRSGELDAVFTAPQVTTRELLHDAMPKLKDTLGQRGMEVATMQVGDGQTRQRGGESTPQKMSKSTTSSDSDTDIGATRTVPAPRMKMGQDGWDVLV